MKFLKDNIESNLSNINEELKVNTTYTKMKNLLKNILKGVIIFLRVEVKQKFGEII